MVSVVSNGYICGTLVVPFKKRLLSLVGKRAPVLFVITSAVKRFEG